MATISRLRNSGAEHQMEKHTVLSPLTYAYNVEVDRIANLPPSSLAITHLPPALAVIAHKMPHSVSEITSPFTCKLSHAHRAAHLKNIADTNLGEAQGPYKKGIGQARLIRATVCSGRLRFRSTPPTTGIGCGHHTLHKFLQALVPWRTSI